MDDNIVCYVKEKPLRDSGSRRTDWIIHTLAYSFLALFIFQSYLIYGMSAIYGWTMTASKALLVSCQLCAVAAVFAGYAEPGEKPEYCYLLSLTFPTALYIMLMHLSYVSSGWFTVGLVTWAAAMILSILVIAIRIMKRRSLATSVYLILTLMLLFLMVPTCLLDEELSSEAPKTSYTEEKTLSRNMEVLQRFEIWGQLSFEEREEAAEALFQVNDNYLRPTENVRWKLKDLDKGTLVSYRKQTHTLYLNRSVFDGDDGHLVINALSHGAYYAYMDSQLELYRRMLSDPRYSKYLDMHIFDPVSSYYVEGYTSGEEEENLLDYYYQSIECYARYYAEETLQDYLAALKEYRAENAQVKLPWNPALFEV